MKKLFTLMAVAAVMAACWGNSNKAAEATEEVVVVEECVCPEGECAEKTAEVPAEAAAEVVAE